MKTSGRRSQKSALKPSKEPKLSRTHPPADLSPVDWQRRLRRQFGRAQAFGLENLTSEPFFSEFRVSNPASKSSYRVAIRGLGPGGNFRSCPDYSTSEFGTCKHIEFKWQSEIARFAGQEGKMRRGSSAAVGRNGRRTTRSTRRRAFGVRGQLAQCARMTVPRMARTNSATHRTAGQAGRLCNFNQCPKGKPFA